MSKKISEQIHAKAKPFIDWLKTAEEEESDEEDDEFEVVITNRSEQAVLKEEAMKSVIETSQSVIPNPEPGIAVGSALSGG